MEQTVYIDLYFIINFAMDFLCFFLTSRLLSIREKLWRVLVASAFGGLYACIALFLPLGAFFGLVADICACALMSVTAYLRRGELRRIFSYALVYAAVSIVLGGFMSALFSLFNRIGLDRLLGSEADADGISVWIFALLAFISGLISVLGGRFFKRKSSRSLCSVRLRDRGRSLEIKGLCDSGNLVCDPISARPCIITELRAIRSILRDSTYSAIESGNVSAADAADMARMRVIPVNTVSGSDMMYALRLERIEIDLGRGYREVDALVAFSLSAIHADGAVAIVPASLDLEDNKI